MAKKTLMGMALAAALALALVASAWAQDAKTLVSTKTAAAPSIDGTMEGAWSSAKPLNVELSKFPYEPKNYKGFKKTKVTLRSMYDGDSVYFLLQWDDPTQSFERFPWVKQADGSWKQLKDLDETGHDNVYYEDKAAMFWNINTAGFENRGCAATCHKARDGKIDGIADKSPARKYTNKPGETVDMWHWKSVRNGPVNQIDDQYVDDTKDPAKNAEWGRKSDVKTGGGYTNNITEDKKGPAFMNKTPSAANKYWVLESEKVPFVDTFKAGDVVGGIIVAPITGPRGDLNAVGKWEGGKWTLEWKRKLVTDGEKAKEHDVQFSDLKKTYHFGVAVFDNSQINHLFHEGAYKMVFK